MDDPEIRPDVGEQFRLVGRALTPDGVRLHVVVEELVGVQVRAVAGQVDEPDLCWVGVDPLRHPPGAGACPTRC